MGGVVGRAARISTALVGAAFACLVIALPATVRCYDDGGGGQAFCIAHHEFCADSAVPIDDGHYLGHDEPSLVFYSSQPGSGNNLAYTLRLPHDPPAFFGQRLAGAVTSAQLYETFWFGMAMCDNQSAPEATSTCVPDSDANIYDNPNPSAPDYIGNHPGTAYMELQFYPPGSPFSVDGAHWYVSLNIFSVQVDQNHGVPNNSSCSNRIGLETVNSAHITTNGIADVPAGPLSTAGNGPDPRTYLVMNPGDLITVLMHDTPEGFQVLIDDLTTGLRGSMTASEANGFSHVLFDPAATTCATEPYAFHPMYSTASEHTRVPWTVHSFNVAIAFEIGHDEAPDHDSDFGPPFYADTDFDGYSYIFDWPGTGANLLADLLLHPQPVLISSPLTSANGGGAMHNFDRAGFEADLPLFEGTCNSATGAGCVNPPAGAKFYPFYTAASDSYPGCAWQFGGAASPQTLDSFGGSSTSEYADLLRLVYPVSGSSASSFSDYRRVLNQNPCQVRPAAIPRLRVRQKLAFPAQAVGSASAAQSVTVSNPYRFPVSIDNIAAIGDFVVSGSNCTAVLRPRSACVIDVGFTPTQTGKRSGALTISDSALNAPQKVDLSGRGTIEMAAVTNPIPDEFDAPLALREAPPTSEVGLCPDRSGSRGSACSGQPAEACEEMFLPFEPRAYAREPKIDRALFNRLRSFDDVIPSGGCRSRGI